MLLRSLFLKTVRDMQGQIWGWGLGLGSLGVMVIALWPAFKDQVGAYMQIFQGMPAALTAFFGDFSQMGSWSGWLQIEFFSYVPPILAVFAVAAGTGIIAGEEERGTLELLLSQPIRRWRVVAEKAGALLVAVLLICLLAALCLLVTALAIGQTQDLDRLFLATLDMAPIALASAAFALMASVLFRRRRAATAVSLVVVIGSFFLESLGRGVNVLKPYRPFALFHYYGGGAPLSGSYEWGNLGVLLGLTVLFLAVALLAFQRRDLGT
jgi:ABC-2 type transport system permease protein